MLRHHSLGSAELVALMGAWRPHPVAEEPRARRIIAFDPADENWDAPDRAAPSNGSSIRDPGP